MATSIAKVSAAKGKEYYYSKDSIMNPEGNGDNLQVVGTLSKALGLEEGSAITEKQLENLLDGKNAAGTVDLVDTKNREIAAYDATFSLTKADSIAFAKGEDLVNPKGTGSVRDDIDSSHREAVNAAIDYLQKVGANTRRYDNEGNRVTDKQESFVAVKAEHSLARAAEKGAAPDPSRHTHVAIMNMAYDQKDNKFKALSADDLFKNQKMADNIFRSTYAKSMIEKGYQMEQKSHGLELKMDQEVIDKFSSRNKSIKEEAEKQGAESYKDIQNIQHKLKEDKTEYAESDLQQAWNEKLQDITNEKGESKYENFEQVFEGIYAKEGEQQFVYENEKEVLEQAAALLTENESVLQEKDLVNAAVTLSGGQFTANDLMNELDNVNKIGQKDPEDLKLLSGKEQGSREFTTKDIYDTEKDTVNIVKNQKQFDPLVREDLAKEGVKSFEEKFHPLNDQQKEAVMTKLTSTDQFITEQGLPGVGKTTILKAFNHALNHAENKMVDEKQMVDKDRIQLDTLAPTNVAAKAAAQEASIEERAVEGKTFAKFVLDTKKEELGEEDKGLSKGESTVDSKKMEENIKEDFSENKDTKDSVKEDKGSDTSSEKKNDSEDSNKTESLKEEKSDKSVVKIDSENENSSKTEDPKKSENTENDSIKKDIKKEKKEDSGFKEQKLDFGSKQSDIQSELFVKNGRKPFTEGKNKGWTVDPLDKVNFGKSDHGKVTAIKSGNAKRGSVTSRITTGEFAGAKMKESWKNNAHFYNKKTEIKFKDGSSYSMQAKGDNKRGIDAVISSDKSYKITNSKGDSQSIKSNTVMGVTLERKQVHNSNGLDQSKIGLKVAGGILEASKNRVSVDLSNGKKKDINESKMGALGFSRLSKTEEIKDRHGEVLARKVTVDKAVFGVSFKREVKIQSKADIEKENAFKAEQKEERKQAVKDTVNNAVNEASDTAKAAMSTVKEAMFQMKEKDNEVKNEKTELIENKDSKITESPKNDNKGSDSSKDNEPKFDIQVKDTVENKLTGEKSEKVVAQGEMTKSNVDKLSKQEAEEPFQKQDRGGKVLMPDETSMASSRDLNTFVKEVSKSDSRAIMIGDTEQFKSIGQGRMFNHLQEKTNTIELTQSMRQKNASEKLIAENLRNSDTQHKSFKELDKNNRFHEIKDNDKRIEKIAEIATSVGSAKGKGFDGVEKEKELNIKNTIVVADNKKDIDKINEAIRDKLHDKGVIDKNDHLKAMTKEVVNMSPVKQAVADNYEKGQYISTFKKGQGIKIGEQYKITKVDTVKNKLTLRDSEGNFRSVQANKIAGNVSVMKLDKEREFSKGDQVIVKVTDKKAGVLNSEMGEVKGFDKEKGTLDVQFKGEDKARTLDMNKELGLNHAYSVTPESSQGGTWDRVVFSVSHDKEQGGRGANKEMTYVAGTRQTHELTVVTDDREALIKGSAKSQVKTSTLDYNENGKIEKKEVENKGSEVKGSEVKGNDQVKAENLDKAADKISEERESKSNRTEANKDSENTQKEEAKAQENQDKVQKEENRPTVR